MLSQLHCCSLLLIATFDKTSVFDAQKLVPYSLSDLISTVQEFGHTF